MRRKELLDELAKATRPNLDLDAAIATTIGGYVLEKRGKDRKAWFYPSSGDGQRKRIDTYSNYDRLPLYTRSIDAAVGLVGRALPGWVWRVATCCVSDDAWVIPDFNCPIHGERLLKELDPAKDWVQVTDIDRRPPGNPAIALCMSVLLALEETQ